MVANGFRWLPMVTKGSRWLLMVPNWVPGAEIRGFEICGAGLRFRHWVNPTPCSLSGPNPKAFRVWIESVLPPPRYLGSRV